jgi:tetratricopeptide (TPR) repeat protein
MEEAQIEDSGDYEAIPESATRVLDPALVEAVVAASRPGRPAPAPAPPDLELQDDDLFSLDEGEEPLSVQIGPPVRVPSRPSIAIPPQAVAAPERTHIGGLAPGIRPGVRVGIPSPRTVPVERPLPAPALDREDKGDKVSLPEAMAGFFRPGVRPRVRSGASPVVPPAATVTPQPDQASAPWMTPAADDRSELPLHPGSLAQPPADSLPGFEMIDRADQVAPPFDVVEEPDGSLVPAPGVEPPDDREPAFGIGPVDAPVSLGADPFPPPAPVRFGDLTLGEGQPVVSGSWSIPPALLELGEAQEPRITREVPAVAGAMPVHQATTAEHQASTAFPPAPSADPPPSAAVTALPDNGWTEPLPRLSAPSVAASAPGADAPSADEAGLTRPQTAPADLPEPPAPVLASDPSEAEARALEPSGMPAFEPGSRAESATEDTTPLEASATPDGVPTPDDAPADAEVEEGTPVKDAPGFAPPTDDAVPVAPPEASAPEIPPAAAAGESPADARPRVTVENTSIAARARALQAELPAASLTLPPPPFPGMEMLTPDPQVEASRSAWIAERSAWRSVHASLTRSQRWPALAWLLARCLQEARWCDDADRLVMHRELAMLARDRLAMEELAEECFAAVLQADPGDEDAWNYLLVAYEARADVRAGVILRLLTVPALSGSHERLERTRAAADIALDVLEDHALARLAWERLRVADGLGAETVAALVRIYRQDRDWSALASLQRQVADAAPAGAVRALAWRELAQTLDRALLDPAAALAALDAVLADAPHDLPALTHRLDLLERQGDLDALAAWDPPSDGPEELRTLRLHVADVLWQGGRAADAWKHDQACAAEVGPDHPLHERIDAMRAARGEHGERIDALIERAEAGGADPASLLERAASLAESSLQDLDLAATLLERAEQLAGASMARLVRLQDLHRSRGDRDALRACAQRMLPLQHDRASRTALQRTLARAASLPPEEPDAAREAWEQVLVLEPGDSEARDALVASACRRQDWSAGRTLLLDQLAREVQPHAAQTLWEMLAGLMADAGLPAEQTRALRAVARFVPCAPEALDRWRAAAVAAGDHAQALDVRQRQAALEGSRRPELLRLLAGELHEAGHLLDAWAVCERILWDAPTDRETLHLAVALAHALQAPERALLVLDRAVLCTPPADRGPWLRLGLAQVPADRADLRLQWAWRVAAQAGWTETELDAVEAAVEAADAWVLWAVWLSHLASDTTDGDRATLLLQRRARVWTTRLDRLEDVWTHALVCLRSGPVDPTVRDSLERLRDTPARHRAWLQVLELDAAADRDVASRVAALLEEAAVLEGPLGSPREALWARMRALLLKPDDTALLDSTAALATAHGLHSELDFLLRQLIDAAASPEARLPLVERWQTNLPLEPHGFEEHLRRVLVGHLAGWTPERRARLSVDANESLLRPWVASLREAWGWTASTDPLSDLARAAADWQAVPAARLRASTLHAWLRLSAPDDASLDEACLAWSGEPAAALWIWEATMAAALQAGTPGRGMALLDQARRMVAGLDEPDALTHVWWHRRMLEPSDGPALEALEAQARSAGAWGSVLALRRSRAESADPETAAAHWREVAAVALDHTGDPVAALEAIEAALALEPGDASLQARWESLVPRAGTPAQRIRGMVLRLQSGRSPDAAAEWMELAGLQQAEGDLRAAEESLQHAMRLDHPGARPALEHLLRGQQRLDELCVMLLQNAEASDAPASAWEQAWQASLDVRQPMASDALLRLCQGMNRVQPERSAPWLRRLQTLVAQADPGSLSETLAHLLDSPAGSRGRALWQAWQAELLAGPLQRPADGVDLWLQRTADAPEGDVHAARCLLRQALVDQDPARIWDAWYTLAHLLPARESAMALCALAEHCDTSGCFPERIADLYREARRLDPWCQPASEALRLISRRISRLRPAAALLADDDEGTLTPRARAERMMSRADAPDESPDHVRDLLRRVVALDPDHHPAWTRLAALADDRVDAFRLRQEAFHAGLRGVFDADRPVALDALVELAWSCAAAALESPAPGDAMPWALWIHAVAPGHLPAARALAASSMAEGQARDALDILLPLVRQAPGGAPDASLAALLADACEALARPQDAAHWRRRALAMDPVASPALAALADLARSEGRHAQAIHLGLGSLVAQPVPAKCAAGMTAMASSFLVLEDPAAAHACRMAAMQWGDRTPALLEALHAWGEETGQTGPAVEQVIEALLSTDLPEDRRRALTLSLGRALAGRPGEEARARQILQQALERDPAQPQVRRWLVDVVERQGDVPTLRQLWRSLLDDTPATRQADLWRRLAATAPDSGQALACWQEVLDREPDLEAAQRVLDALQHTAPHSRDAELAAARVAALGPRPLDAVLAAGMRAIDHRPALGWLLLAPLLLVRQGEDTLRARLRDMRKDHERPPLLVATAEDRADFLPLNVDSRTRAWLHALRLLDGRVQAGATTPAELPASEVFEVSAHSSTGRTFGALAEAFGVAGAGLHRANTLAEPVMVCRRARGGADVVLRADVFQSMARAEIGFVLGQGLSLASHPGAFLFSVEPAARTGMLAAIARWAMDLDATVMGLPAAHPGTTAALADLDDETRAQVAHLLGPALEDTLLPAMADALHAAILGQARIAGLIAGGDLYQVHRVLARMDQDAERAASFTHPDHLNECLIAVPAWHQLAAFACTPHFADALARARDISPA